MAFDFTGSKILITGVGRGIGRELAKSIAKAGGEVYGLSRQKEHLDTLVKECATIHPIQVDLSDWEATRAELEKLGPMNGLVNNAGVFYESTPSLEVSKEMIDKTLSVNLMARINVIQVVGKKMVEAGEGGSIVNVSSINSINAMPGSMAANISDAALNMVTKQFALELGPHQIRVNSVNPTTVLTAGGKEFMTDCPDLAGKLKAQTPLCRFAEVQEVIGPIMYLLSDYSTMVTGTVNPIDGGLLCNISV